jgi:hypothetical protein
MTSSSSASSADPGPSTPAARAAEETARANNPIRIVGRWAAHLAARQARTWSRNSSASSNAATTRRRTPRIIVVGHCAEYRARAPAAAPHRSLLPSTPSALRRGAIWKAQVGSFSGIELFINRRCQVLRAQGNFKLLNAQPPLSAPLDKIKALALRIFQRRMHLPGTPGRSIPVRRPTCLRLWAKMETTTDKVSATYGSPPAQGTKTSMSLRGASAPFVACYGPACPGRLSDRAVVAPRVSGPTVTLGSAR